MHILQKRCAVIETTVGRPAGPGLEDDRCRHEDGALRKVGLGNRDSGVGPLPVRDQRSPASSHVVEIREVRLLQLLGRSVLRSHHDGTDEHGRVDLDRLRRSGCASALPIHGGGWEQKR